MPRSLDYASAEPPPRPRVALLVASAIWWTFSLAWLVKCVAVLRSPAATLPDDLAKTAVATAIAIGTSIIFALSLFGRSIWATKGLVILLSVTSFLILLIGLTSGTIALLSGTERLAVAWIIFGETVGLAAFAAASAWLFRCWLRDIELYEAR